MELRQLATFVAVAEEGSFTRASASSERACRAVPAVGRCATTARFAQSALSDCTIRAIAFRPPAGPGRVIALATIQATRGVD